jgi:hypothetical protein
VEDADAVLHALLQDLDFDPAGQGGQPQLVAFADGGAVDGMVMVVVSVVSRYV